MVHWGYIGFVDHIHHIVAVADEIVDIAVDLAIVYLQAAVDCNSQKLQIAGAIGNGLVAVGAFVAGWGKLVVAGIHRIDHSTQVVGEGLDMEVGHMGY